MRALILFASFLLIPFFAKADNAFFVVDGKSDYYIHLPPKADKTVIHAAEELGKYMNQVFGLKCKLVSGDQNKQKKCIILTKSPALSVQAQESVPSNGNLGEDGYCIKIAPDAVSFVGRNDRGVLYGVYSFLEKYAGCRWYSSEVSRIPKRKQLKLPITEESYSPIVKWREVYYYDLCDPDIAAKLMLNGNTLKKGLAAPNRKAITGGSHANWGLWCHSLYSLVSPQLYDTHPEYFSEINGKRIDPRTKENQLCLTNPDLLPIAINSLNRLIKQKQKDVPVWGDSLATYWSVSQMDGGGNCTCPACRQSDAHEGSPSGTMLKFVNEVAKAFPDKKIATLAYTYTRKAPLHVKPAPNVVIQMCAIETARQAINFPIATSEIHKKFREDLSEWGKLCNEILVWDYIIQFQNLIAPFPNFSTMQDNINFYIRNNVYAIFCQGNREKGGEFSELRAYLLAKILWNPQCDVEKEMDDFLNGFYGNAAPFIKKYIKAMESELKASKLRLSMDGEPEAHKNGYLSEKCIKRYKRWFDSAEKAVARQPEFLKRVRKERMGIMYAQIRLEYGSVKERRALLEQLIQLAQENEVWMFSEVDWRKDQSGNRDMFYRKYKQKLANP